MFCLSRSALALAALALALASCAEPKATGLPAGPTKEPEPLTNVKVIDNSFGPTELTIKPGEEVTWIFEGSAPHNVQAVDRSFNSHPQCAADITKCSASTAPPFKREFSKAGTYAYFCVIHGQPNGQGMAGTIVVEA
ncbi:MAG: cupredoxin domain-containing protein [Actinomycetota bacterium]